MAYRVWVRWGNEILGKKKNITPTLVLVSDTVQTESFHTKDGPDVQDKENFQQEEEEIAEKIVQEKTRKPQNIFFHVERAEIKFSESLI